MKYLCCKALNLMKWFINFHYLTIGLSYQIISINERFNMHRHKGKQINSLSNVNMMMKKIKEDDFMRNRSSKRKKKNLIKNFFRVHTKERNWKELKRVVWSHWIVNDSITLLSHLEHHSISISFTSSSVFFYRILFIFIYYTFLCRYLRKIYWWCSRGWKFYDVLSR